MTLFFPASEFFESSGNAANQFNEDLRDAIVNHACNIWGSFPTFVTKGRNPASSFARGFMNSACSSQQSPPPINPPTFSGGQCCDKQYIVTTSWEFIQCNGNVAFAGSANPTILGKINGIDFRPNPSFPSQYEVVIDSEDCAGVSSETVVFSTTTPVQDSCDIPVGQPGQSDIDRSRSSWQIDSIVTSDGSSDDCGDPPPVYPPEPPPTNDDLNITINISNNDGVDNVFDLTWNQTDNNYNFPFNFKLNGVNVNLSTGGLTIFGNPNSTGSNGGDSSPPPGSDGGRDKDGNKYTVRYEEGDYPEPPTFTQPNLGDTDINYLICDSGIIQEIIDTVKLIPGTAVWIQIVLDLLSAIIEEFCEEEEAALGFPEIYPSLPGVDRPIVMLYYKEVVDGVKGAPSWVSTVPNPSALTIATLPTLTPPDRTLGKHVCSIKLLDGSRLVARGNTVQEADNQFNFLLGLVDSSFIPDDVPGKKIVTLNNRFQEWSVKCTQIEYYPDGKNYAVSPAERYFPNVT